MQILTFTLGNSEFGIPLKDVEHVEEKESNVMELPTAPEYVKGVAMVREEIVPVYSLALRFGYTEEKTRYLIIVIVRGMKVGIEADKVNKIISIDDKEICQSPFLGETQQYFLKGFILFCEKQLIILIDVSRLMMQEEREIIDQLVIWKNEESNIKYVK